MVRRRKPVPTPGLVAALLVPLTGVALFHILKDNRALMNFWVFQIMAPVEQFWGQLWSLVPFSGMELMVALVLVGTLVWLVRTLWLFRTGWWAVLRSLLGLIALWLWLWCGLCWLWNGAYYADTFLDRSGLETRLYSVAELRATTAQFAQTAARLSGQVPRDEGGHFLENRDDYRKRGVEVYRNLTSKFPCLSMRSVEVKPIFFSRLQSRLGFTGMYFPFTGEANVNIDKPVCLFPATIAHEMAHQRMVASEQEANFVGIAACLSCDDVVFQYSGALFGLMELSNALYSVDPDGWYAIAGKWFTPELSTDWEDNNAYWRAMDSQVEEAAEEVYDSFLKGNDQELGVRSYGACVDLLVSYFNEE